LKEEQNDDEEGDPSYKAYSYKMEKSPKKERSERMKCKRCPKTFAYMAALVKHKQRHKEEEEFGDKESDDEEEDEVVAASAEDEALHMFRCEEGCSESSVRNGRYTARFKLEGS
jgi:hypothetical protein